MPLASLATNSCLQFVLLCYVAFGRCFMQDEDLVCRLGVVAQISKLEEELKFIDKEIAFFVSVRKEVEKRIAESRQACGILAGAPHTPPAAFGQWHQRNGNVARAVGCPAENDRGALV